MTTRISAIRTIPDWPKSSANLRQPPARPARRVPPWAGGIAFVVVATSVIALQHYLQSGRPFLALTDRSRAVVSSLVGDTSMRPAAPSATNTETPAPVEPVPSAAEPAPAAVMADISEECRWRWSSRPCSRPPMIDGDAKPRRWPGNSPGRGPEPPPPSPPPSRRPLPSRRAASGNRNRRRKRCRTVVPPPPGTRRDRSTRTGALPHREPKR